jgi:hypothetical protein
LTICAADSRKIRAKSYGIRSCEEIAVFKPARMIPALRLQGSVPVRDFLRSLTAGAWISYI